MKKFTKFSLEISLNEFNFKDYLYEVKKEEGKVMNEQPIDYQIRILQAFKRGETISAEDKSMFDEVSIFNINDRPEAKLDFIRYNYSVAEKEEFRVTSITIDNFNGLTELLQKLHIPKHYRWAAVDRDGELYLYSDKPEAKTLSWHAKVDDADCLNLGNVNYKGNWKESIIYVGDQ